MSCKVGIISNLLRSLKIRLTSQTGNTWCEIPWKIKIGVEKFLTDVDRQARTTLCLLLEIECFIHVYNANTAKEVE